MKTSNNLVLLKHQRRKCKHRGCNNRARKHGRDCNKCRMREWRKRNPMRAAYNTCRSKAKRRGLTWCLPFWYFEHFANQCDYLKNKGNFSHCITIDRINNRLGYVPGNIRPMSRGDNIARIAKHEERRIRHGYAWQFKFKN